MINRVRTKYLLLLVSAVAIGLVLVWAAVHRRASYGKSWLLVSAPTIGSRTNAEASRPTVTLRVSNVGPRRVDFQVWWFECRAERDGNLLATNQLRFVPIPLPPGKSTNLTMDVSLGAAPLEDCLCCCQVRWIERESSPRDGATRLARWWFNFCDVYWEPREPPRRLISGSVFAANIEVADYFRRMHGYTRAQWLEDSARQQAAAQTQANGGEVVQGLPWQPTAGEMLELEARSAFTAFCQESTEPTAATKAAPPHR